MKIFYIANVRLPTEKAHGVQIMQMCRAFARRGCSVDLVIPWRFNKIVANPFSYYGIEGLFKIDKLFSIDSVRWGRLGFWLQSLSFAKSVFFFSLFKKADIFYGRDELPLATLSLLHKKIIWEAHMPRYNFFVRWVIKHSSFFVVISEGLKQFFMERGVSPEKIVVLHDGVDLASFNALPTKEECRKILKLPLQEKQVVYTGHLYAWKGVDVLAEATSYIHSATVYCIGGTEKDIASFRKKHEGIKSLRIVGYREPREIPLWLKSADMLILPNSGKSRISKNYTSPLKLFEYMASGTPLVASNLPSIREIVDEESALLVEADDPHALAKGIQDTLSDTDAAQIRSQKAREIASLHSWENRAHQILSLVR